jgi:hypothetical protein
MISSSMRRRAPAQHDVSADETTGMDVCDDVTAALSAITAAPGCLCDSLKASTGEEIL